MNREHWQTVKPLLDRALELEPDARTAWLSDLATSSPDVAREIENLFALESRSDDLFGASLTFALPAAKSWAGRIVDNYRLEREIGQGGMGSVWLARRNDGRFEGEVAFKLLNRALLGRGGQARFAHEGRVLARLNHPNIARLMDAGVTEEGQPFLVLEYVVGTRIDRFADERRYTPVQRIELLLEVLSAVASAHASLVVHRDIKPSNILVDDTGRPKLLDFGIAKLLAPGGDVSDPSTLTDESGRALTPEYAAPEQIRGEPISTATDVYSLGVLLYVLLTGRHPTSEGCTTTADQIRTVLDVEPPRLSEAAAGLSDTAAAARGSTPDRLSRLYRGDLDNILSKTLKKLPAERYRTVNELAADLSRFLHHEPVTARADSWAYRTRKFVRRNRVAVLAAVVAVSSLLAGTVVSVRQMVIAQHQRDRAENAARRSAAGNAFETLLFRLIRPGGEALTYRQLLDKGREALEKQYRGDPVSRIQLRFQFAQHYGRDFDVPTARAILASAAQIADSIQQPRFQAEARCELAITFVHERAADSAARLVADARRRLAGLGDVERGTQNACDQAEAELFSLRGMPDSAIRLFGAIVDRYRASGDTANANYFYGLNDQAGALMAARRPREGLRLLIELTNLAHSGGPSDPQAYPTAVYNTGFSFEWLGEFVGRRDFLAREIRRYQTLNPSAPINGLLAYGYGNAWLRLDGPDSAAFWFQRAAEHSDDLPPPERYVTHRQLAILARQRGAHADADRHIAEAEKFGGPGNRTGARTFVAVEKIRSATSGRPRDDTRAAVSAALDSIGYSPRTTRGALMDPLLAAAEGLTRVGVYDDAARYAAEAVRIASVDSLAATQSGWFGLGLFRQARAQLARADTAAARDLVARSIAPLRFALGDDHSVYRSALALRDSLARR